MTRRLIRRFKQMRVLICWMAPRVMPVRRPRSRCRRTVPRPCRGSAWHESPVKRCRVRPSKVTVTFWSRCMLREAGMGTRHRRSVPRRNRSRASGERGWLPYTPDEIAVPLVAAALRLIGSAADDVIALQVRAQMPTMRRWPAELIRAGPGSLSSTRSPALASSRLRTRQCPGTVRN